MQVLIIEDEQLAADRLIHLIGKTDQEIHIFGHVDTVRDAVSTLTEHGDKIDLLFCDIQLADGLSFEIFEQIDFRKPVIFTTAYDQYAIEAFKVNSMNYLLKPIKEEELKRSLRKYHDIFRTYTTFNIEQVKKLLNQDQPVQNKRILVKSGIKLIPVKLNEIALFFIQNKNVYAISAEEERQYLIDHTLDELMSDHLDPNHFFRINRKQIVNVENIVLIKPYLNQRLSLSLKVATDEELIVSREKVKDFRKWFVNE